MTRGYFRAGGTLKGGIAIKNPEAGMTSREIKRASLREKRKRVASISPRKSRHK